jgi:hypothetical protein
MGLRCKGRVTSVEIRLLRTVLKERFHCGIDHLFAGMADPFVANHAVWVQQVERWRREIPRGSSPRPAGSASPRR